MSPFFLQKTIVKGAREDALESEIIHGTETTLTQWHKALFSLTVTVSQVEMKSIAVHIFKMQYFCSIYLRNTGDHCGVYRR